MDLGQIIHMRLSPLELYLLSNRACSFVASPRVSFSFHDGVVCDVECRGLYLVSNRSIVIQAFALEESRPASLRASVLSWSFSVVG